MRGHPLQTGGTRITRQQELYPAWGEWAPLPAKHRCGGPGMLAVAERAEHLARIAVQGNVTPLAPFATAHREEPTALTEVHIVPGQHAEFRHPYTSVQHQRHGGVISRRAE